MEIKFCENNLNLGSEVVAQKLKREIKEINLEIEPCLGCCGECAEKPFALIKEEVLLADSADDLYVKIIKNLN